MNNAKHTEEKGVKSSQVQKRILPNIQYVMNAALVVAAPLS